MTDLEQVLASYGCNQYCYTHNDCNNCWFKQKVNYELERLKARYNKKRDSFIRILVL